MTTTKTLVTADELLNMPADGYRYELVKGELRQMALSGGEHGVTVMKLAVPLFQFVEERDLGIVVAANTGFKLASEPDTVCAPDVAFIKRERIINRELPKGFWPGAPDLVVEVISPDDTYLDVEDKIAEWFDAGTSLVILVNPGGRTVRVYRSFIQTKILTEADQLTCGDVIPGFSYPVAKLFADKSTIGK